MEILLVKIATALSLPPGGNLLLMALGVLVKRFWRRLGLTLLWLGGVSLWLMSTQPVSGLLEHALQRFPPLTRAAVQASRPQAIVVLAGGRVSNSPEYGSDTVSLHTLGRIRFAARLYRETLLPVMVSGGTVYGEDFAESFLMKEVLIDDFKVPVLWTEERSWNTWENALYSAKILQEDDIDTVILVTDAFHMARAVAAFEAQGLKVLAAPTNFKTSVEKPLVLEWLPNAGALKQARSTLHEVLGQLWYSFRYGS